MLLWFTVTASLALVSTVALTRYLDSVHFEEDLLMAETLNDRHFDHNPLENEYYSAYDIRKFIMYHSGQTYDFEPKTSNAGFFYIRSQNKIIASKFSEIDQIVIDLGLDQAHLLSDDPAEERHFSSPEELFKDGLVLLSTSGSLVAETVNAIRILPETPFPSETYQRLNRELNKTFKHLIHGNQDEIPLLKDLAKAYDPSKTLYANNTYWSTTATAGSNIKRILFANGIGNILLMILA